MGCTHTKKLGGRSPGATSVILKDFSDVCQRYAYKRMLGHGRYGQVFLAESWETRQQVAIKAIPRLETSMAEAMREIEILSEVDHPNIVKYIKHYNSRKYLYIVMEYCEHEELLKRVLGQEMLTESETRIIMEKLLRAVNHCHHLNIIHRDLKLENVMYSPKGALKLIDFGLSIKLRTVSYERLTGTAHYIAPEIVKAGMYTKACDMWSLGIMMYIMLSGYIPIGGYNLPDVLESIKKFKGPFFHSKLWRNVSAEAKDLLKKLLNPKHEARITADEALRHPWFASRKGSSSSHNTDVLEALKRYCKFPTAKRSILELIVKSVNDTELREYQETFLDLDKEKTGLITSSELEENLSEKGMSKKELEDLTRKINHKGNPFITYSELMATLIATKRFLTEERLNSVYKMLKPDRSLEETKFSASDLI